MLFQKGEKDRKKKGYNLKDGKIIYKTGLVDEVTAKAGRASSKKSNEDVNRNKGEFLFSVPKLRYGGVNLKSDF